MRSSTPFFAVGSSILLTVVGCLLPIVSSSHTPNTRYLADGEADAIRVQLRHAKKCRDATHYNILGVTKFASHKDIIKVHVPSVGLSARSCTERAALLGAEYLFPLRTLVRCNSKQSVVTDRFQTCTFNAEGAQSVIASVLCPRRDSPAFLCVVVDPRSKHCCSWLTHTCIRVHALSVVVARHTGRRPSCGTLTSRRAVKMEPLGRMCSSSASTRPSR